MQEGRKQTVSVLRADNQSSPSSWREHTPNILPIHDDTDSCSVTNQNDTHTPYNIFLFHSNRHLLKTVLNGVKQRHINKQLCKEKSRTDLILWLSEASIVTDVVIRSHR